MRTPTTAPRGGSALVSVVIVMVVLAGLSAALLSTSLFRQGAAKAIHEEERAFQQARTGIDLALYELREELDLGADGIGNVDGALSGGTYSVTVDPPYAGEGEYVLVATGRFRSVGQGVEFVVTSDDGYPYGLFGRTSVTTGGAYGVDSYDATLGTYASQVFGDHAGEFASVGSNGDIVVDGGTVWGDTIPGPGHQVLGDAGRVQGSTAPAASAWEPEPVDYAPAIASAGSIHASTTLTTGTYRYDDVHLRGGNVLVLDGDVTLYVDAELDVSGNSYIDVTPGSNVTILCDAGPVVLGGNGVVNQDQLPGSLEILVAGASTVEFSGSAAFHGVIYAPDSDFTSNGNADMFGAIVANSADLWGSGVLHVDESLRGGIGHAGFRVKSARRVAASDS